MKVFITSALALILLSGAAQAAVSCPDRAPAPIQSVSEDSRKCQETIAREGSKFLKIKMAKMTACKLKRAPGSCPTTKDADSLTKAAQKRTEKIAAACGSPAARAGLTSSYAAVADANVIGSCMLSQLNVVGDYVVANAVGSSTEPWPGTGKERALCVKEVAKWGRLFVQKALTNASVCIKKQMKAGIAGDLAPICVGSFSGGSFVPPSDVKTALKQEKLVDLVEEKLAKRCDSAQARVETIFGCAGATNTAGLHQCLVCEGWGSVFDGLEQQYSEDGTYVAHGADAIQTAVDAAGAGGKLLIAPGTYQEEVLMSEHQQKIVGCGGATNNRPRIEPPTPEVIGRGFRSANVDGLVFQSLEVFGQLHDGFRNSFCNGIVYRDIVADGNLVSAYAVFPINCDNVLVELCNITRVDDAPVYVGQSSNIVVRHNEVRQSVAGIEIENCGNARVYGNYATENTAGLLVFKDGGLPVQLSDCHEVHHNIFERNNTENFGTGTVAQVPTGTGMLVISNDTTVFHHNVSRDNDTFGFAFTDQGFSGFGPPFSADQDPEENYVVNNVFINNGGSPWFLFGGDAIVATLSSAAANGNCANGNFISDGPASNLETDLPDCPPGVPTFASCPAAPVL